MMMTMKMKMKMVSKKAKPSEGFYLDASGMAVPGMGPLASGTTTMKVRKPYTITKSRESWTQPEHDKFLEALHLFDRDWKKIEAFVGSKTVIQIRSHAQKYFLKVQKNGTGIHLPPPRPKRKATHPYPQKASKNATVLSESPGSYLSSSFVLEPGYFLRPDSSSVPTNQIAGASEFSWTSNLPKAPMVTNNCCSSSESTPRIKPWGDIPELWNDSQPLRVLPDFAQVYSFIGSVFDANVSGHLQKLKMMDPIDIETVLLLMRNLAINLTSPDFEDHRWLLSSYETDTDAMDASEMLNDNLSKNV